MYKMLQLEHNCGFTGVSIPSGQGVDWRGRDRVGWKKEKPTVPAVSLSQSWGCGDLKITAERCGMSSQEIPDKFEWVKARSECLLPTVFKELEQGVREDVDAAQSLVPPRSELKFSFAKAATRSFSAVRVDDPMRGISRSVDFLCAKDKIEAYDNSQLLYSASLTLNNEGKCRLLVEHKELTQWQFRRMALEKLFFGPFE
jgi:hypothetical protein